MSDQRRLVMPVPGLDPGNGPGIHDFIGNVDGRNKPGHDDWKYRVNRQKNSEPDGHCGQPDNLISVCLRRLDEKSGRIVERLDDLTQRVTSLEPKTGLLHNDFTRQPERIDQIELRLGRIERRLDIVGAVE